MKISKRAKILLIIAVILILFVVFAVFLIKNLSQLTLGTNKIEKELNVEYVLTDLAPDMPTNEDLNSLITKLNNNVPNMVTNGKLNIYSNFKFNQDFNLTLKEFCCLLNLVQVKVNDDESFKFDELDLVINASGTDKFNLTIFFEIDKTKLNKELNLSLSNNILFKIQSNRNKNNIATNTQIISINGINYVDASDELKDFINTLNNLDIFDEISNELKSLFNCYYEFCEEGVKIYA